MIRRQHYHPTPPSSLEIGLCRFGTAGSTAFSVANPQPFLGWRPRMMEKHRVQAIFLSAAGQTRPSTGSAATSGLGGNPGLLTWSGERPGIAIPDVTGTAGGRPGLTRFRNDRPAVAPRHRWYLSLPQIASGCMNGADHQDEVWI